MPSGRHKSRTFRRVQRRTPGSRTVERFENRNPQIAKCGVCGAILKGVPRARPFKMKKLGKTKKRPERPFGGVLCTRCMRKKMTEKARL